MPELPEVETMRRDLSRLVKGRTLTGARIHQSDILLSGEPPERFDREIAGRRIRDVRRRAKVLLLELSGDRVLEVQVRMTGRFAVTEPPPDREELGHIAAELDLEDGRVVYYDDVRRLGGLRLQSRRRWEERARRLGPEPLDAGFTPGRLGGIMADRRAPVKNVLLDQRRVAGIGNIYACEALHAARIDPRRAGGSLGEDDIRRLRTAIRRTLRDALANAGTTFRDYRAVNGRSGDFQDHLRVYAREDGSCARCGERIVRITQAGRSTFFCPGCQS